MGLLERGNFENGNLSVREEGDCLMGLLVRSEGGCMIAR